MSLINSVSLVGRLGQDPETRYFPSGSVLVKLSVAVDRQTSRDEQPDWFTCELWGKTAEVAANYTSKGSLIGVTGSLKLETWSDRNSGEQRTKPIIKVDRLQLLSAKPQDADSSASPSDDYYNGTDF
ncbi:single-stranded DNA-binding protein [Coleofasciculus sp.]|uniref:single-stranded DNA-binding protein n=1 Tax=Coleofasciculus sp. TaxID=3100458 RepID=UPI003A15D337